MFQFVNPHGTIELDVKGQRQGGGLAGRNQLAVHPAPRRLDQGHHQNRPDDHDRRLARPRRVELHAPAGRRRQRRQADRPADEHAGAEVMFRLPGRLSAALARAGLGRGLSTTCLRARRHPDLSGFWSLTRGKPVRDPALEAKFPPNTVILDDTGGAELPIGDYGGLKPKPAALAAAKAWKPADDMTLEKVCSPPSIIYALQGPFPIEIFQGTELIVMKLEYYDLVRIIFMNRKEHLPPDAPHSKVGDSIGRWEGDTLVVDTTHLLAGHHHQQRPCPWRQRARGRALQAQRRQKDADSHPGIRGSRYAGKPRRTLHLLDGAAGRPRLSLRVRPALCRELFKAKPQ